MTDSRLATRVTSAAEAIVASQRYVAPIDVLCRIGWLHPTHVDSWRQCRVADLAELAAVSEDRLLEAATLVAQWAQRRGLVADQVEYVSGTRDRRPLRFTVDGAESIEAVFRTHWTSADLTDSQRERLTAKQAAAPDLTVIESLRDFTCTVCGGTDSLLSMQDGGPVCMACADLDHLVFLAAGDAALTRRAKKASGLTAVVLRFNSSRKRYQRRGILVEPQALDRAEEECLADEDLRQRRRERDRIRREHGDVEFVADMAEAIVRLFPACPPDRAEQIAAHAAVRGSGRVGRSAAGRALDANAVTAAVVASVRHTDTAYDELLMAGVPRQSARDRIRTDIDGVLASWRG